MNGALGGRAPALRVVYDGAPEAGKTTSLVAMARMFEELVVVPEEEDGRTVFFDWLEHTIEVPQGKTYRMQLVSVPGQARWGARRAHLVSFAHVLLFVADTRRRSWPETLERWRHLLATRAEGGMPPIVFQANKRDCEDSIPLADIRAVVPPEIPVVESSAARDEGVKEAFWEAVRLGSRLVADIEEPPDELDDPQGLLDKLIALDATTDQLLAQASAVRDGFVWPPVEGRALLREALAARSDLQVVGSGLHGGGRGWRVFSPAKAIFPTLDAGRAALLEWARVHGRLGRSLSPRRCIVVLETTNGQFRLWQLVHHEPTASEYVAPHGAPSTGPMLVERLLRAVLAVRTIRLRGKEVGVELPCTLDTVGWGQGPQFVGMMPYPLEAPADGSWDDLAWEVETFLVHDADGTIRGALEAVVASHRNVEERDYLHKVFGG